MDDVGAHDVHGVPCLIDDGPCLACLTGSSSTGQLNDSRAMRATSLCCNCNLICNVSRLCRQVSVLVRSRWKLQSLTSPFLKAFNWCGCTGNACATSASVGNIHLLQQRSSAKSMPQKYCGLAPEEFPLCFGTSSSHSLSASLQLQHDPGGKAGEAFKQFKADAASPSKATCHVQRSSKPRFLISVCKAPPELFMPRPARAFWLSWNASPGKFSR